MGNFFRFLERLNNKHFLIAAVVILLAGTIIMWIRLTSENTLQSPQSGKTTATPGASSINTQPGFVNVNKSGPKTIYYVKSDYLSDETQTTEIFTADSKGMGITKHGQIRGMVEQIVPLSSDSYLYVSDLGFLDRGQTIYQYRSDIDSHTIVYRADEQFGIESYMVSPDLQSFVVWETTMPGISTGTTRIVYQKIIDQSSKKVVMSEHFSDQIKYPIYWNPQTNELILDSYSGQRGGLARGIFTLALSGILTPVSALSRNNYSSSPVFSRDNKYAAYTTYNAAAAKKLPALGNNSEISRIEVRNPNEVKLWNTKTGKIATIVSHRDGIIIDRLVFGTDSKLIFRTKKIEADGSITPLEYRTFDIASGKDDLYSTNSNGIFFDQFENGTALLGFQTRIGSGLGGVSTPFSQVLDSVYLYDAKSGQYDKIISDEPVQLIAIL